MDTVDKNLQGSDVKRRTFVLLTRSITDHVANTIWQGFMDEGQDCGINLITCHGGQLGKEPGSLIYSLVVPERYDGFIGWSSSDKDQFVSYYDRFQHHPLLTLTLPVKGFPVISVDSYLGMKELMEHLVGFHQFKRIAFIRGPEEHVYAKQRYEAYLHVMKNHGLYADALVTPPLRWLTEDGIKGAKLFFDERKLKPGKDIQAIVCVSDVLALGALAEMHARGIRVPEDVALAGFNGSKEAHSALPPVTTVAMPFYQQGKTAVTTLLDMVRERPVPPETSLAAQLVVEQSCGCRSPMVDLAAINRDKRDADKEMRVSLKGLFERIPEGTAARGPGPREKIAAAMAQAASHCAAEKSVSEDDVRQQCMILLCAFLDEIDKDIHGLFLSKLHALIRKMVDTKCEMQIWQNVLSVMRRCLSAAFEKSRYAAQAEDLFGQARLMLSDAAERFKERQFLQLNRQQLALQEVGAALLTSYNIKKLLTALVAGLRRLSIRRCYLCLYENPETATSLFVPPESARLVLALDENGRRDLNEEGLVFPSVEILPKEILLNLKHFNLVVEALTFQSSQIGYIIFEVGPRDGFVYTTLANQLSSALYGTLLLKETNKIKDFLGETLDTVKVKAEVVSDHSLKISDNVENISGSMKEVAGKIHEISRSLNEVMEIINNSVTIAQNANNYTMELSTQSKKIGAIIGIINEVAEKINILSLNASIEAARAGMSGKGFAVVAREVKELARKTVSSTNEIVAMIKDMQGRTKDTASAITGVVDIISKVSVLYYTITKAISAQVDTTNAVSSMLDDAAQDSKGISQAIDEVAVIARQGKGQEPGNGE